MDDRADDTTISEDADDSNVVERSLRAPSLTRLGRYRLVREIASGGMASVSLAVADGLDKLVAVKMIHPHLVNEGSFVDMFLDEAKIASAISHRNVCATFDFGEVDGRYFLAMEYLAGQSLRDVIARLKKSPIARDSGRVASLAAYVIAEAAEGLHAAHEVRGADGEPLAIVHRDVSPHNLFLTYDGNVSVVDFGIARAAGRLQHTATGILKGKFSYMAPEQIRQMAVDRRADIWGLGVCLWEMLTRRRLFVRSSQADTLMSVMMDRVRAPSDLDSSLPRELDAIVLKALARSPERRYQTARELGRDLMTFVRSQQQPIGPIELEELMAELFANEITQSRRLIRSAKQGGTGETHDSLLAISARVPTQSGSMLRAPSVAAASKVSGLKPDSAGPAEIAAPAQGLRDRPLLRLSVGLALVTGVALALLVERMWMDRFHAVPAVLRAPTAAPLAAPPLVPAAPAPSLAAVAPTSLPAVQTEPAASAPLPVPAERSSRVAARAADAPASSTSAAPRSRSGAAKSSLSSASRSVFQPNASSHLSAPAQSEIDVSPREEAANTVQLDERQAPAVELTVVAPIAVSDQNTLRAASSSSEETKPKVIPEPTREPQAFTAQASIQDLQVDGSLGSGVVMRTLSRVHPLLSSCYAHAATRARQNRYVALKASLTIDEMGAIRQVETSSHPLSGLADCVADSLKRIRSERKPDVGIVRVRFDVSYRAP